MFKYRDLNFIYSRRTDSFHQVQYVNKLLHFLTFPSYNTAKPYSEIYELAKTHPNRDFHMLLFLRNVIDIPVKSYLTLLIDEILHPFYIFQLFSVVVWMVAAYYVSLFFSKMLTKFQYYASAIFLISLISNIISLVETRRSMVKLSTTAKYVCSVNRLTPTDDSMQTDTISSEELVPGDLIEIPDQFTMPCDCVVLQGTIIVNEAMLTGESIPVTKVLIPNTSQVYNVDADRNYTLFAGTTVLQIRKSQQ
jgi:cation-transporting ATPase 13A2